MATAKRYFSCSHRRSGVYFSDCALCYVAKLELKNDSLEQKVSALEKSVEHYKNAYIGMEEKHYQCDERIEALEKEKAELVGMANTIKVMVEKLRKYVLNRFLPMPTTKSELEEKFMDIDEALSKLEGGGR